jgi:hypothetical protein
MDYSFELCSAQERIVWARLDVFSGGFELDAVEGVCSDEQLPPGEVLDVVASLVDRSVLGREEYGSHVRYRMLETIRQYGQEKLEEQGEVDIWRRRHRDWYAELAARAEGDLISPRQLEWASRLRREQPNFRAALELSVADPGEAAAGMRIASALDQEWVARGTLSEGCHWLARALAHPTAASVERARALRLDAWLAVLQSDSNEAARMLDEARPLADAAGDDVARAYVLQTSGMLAMFQGDLSPAVDLLDQAVAIFRSAGHIMGQAQTAFLLGMNLGLAGGMPGVDRAARGAVVPFLFPMGARTGRVALRGSAPRGRSGEGQSPDETRSRRSPRYRAVPGGAGVAVHDRARPRTVARALGRRRRDLAGDRHVADRDPFLRQLPCRGRGRGAAAPP